MRYRVIGFVALALTLATGAVAVLAQPAPSTLRIALLRQWVVNQHRVPAFGFNRQLPPEFAAAVQSGVVDRTVFAWQRGRIQRWWLVKKPVRVLPGPEAAALGGRGQFDLVAVRPPLGPAAWTEVEVAARPGDADAVLLLDVGGDVDVMNQVLETVAVIPAGGGPLQEVPVVRLVGRPPASTGSVVPVVLAPTFGEPFTAARSNLFGRIGGVEILVVRSPVNVIVDGAFTNNGGADLATETAGEWRNGDDVLIRVPLATLRSGTPSLVLAWKDRVTKPESEGGGHDVRPDS